MKKTDRKKLAGAGLYIALAACVLSAMTINVVSGIKNKTTSGEDLELSAVDLHAEGVTDDTDVSADTEKNNKATVSSATPDANEEITTNKPQTPIEKDKPSENGGAQTPSDETAPDTDKEKTDETASVSQYREFVMPVANGELGTYKGDELIYSEVFGDYRVHEGIDIKANLGDSVMSFCDGTVTQVYDHALMGKTIVIDHGNGLISVYKNLGSDIPEGIAAGASVKAGDVIGSVGNSSLAKCSSDPHLHFEITYNEESVDPIQYLSTSGK